LADEAVIVELLGDHGDAIRYTIASSNIAKGTLMEFTPAGNRLVRAHTTKDMAFAGIAAEEVTATSGITQIAVYTNGIFDLTFDSAGATDVGHCVAMAEAAELNNVTPADASDILQGGCVGNTLEAADNDEIALVRVRAHRAGAGA
jgi:hypothetical protein